MIWLVQDHLSVSGECGIQTQPEHHSKGFFQIPRYLIYGSDAKKEARCDAKGFGEADLRKNRRNSRFPEIIEILSSEPGAVQNDQYSVLTKVSCWQWPQHPHI